MTRVKRLFALFLCMVFVVSSLTIPVEAATYSITSFGANSKWESSKNYYDIYNTLRFGKITVEKYKGEYCYKFKNGSTTVWVKPSAFTSSVGNDFSVLNKNINKVIKDGSGVTETWKTVYKERGSSNKVYKLSKNKSLTAPVKTTYLAHIEVDTLRSTDDTTLELGCEMTSYVQFEFQTKYKSGSKLKTPTTKAELKNALVRKTGRVSTTMVPQFEVRVENPGTKKIALAACSYNCKGVLGFPKATDCVDVIYDAAKTLSAPNYVSVYKLGVKAVKMAKDTRGTYRSEKSIQLSGKSGGKKVGSSRAATLESPILLSKGGDYCQVFVKTNKTFSPNTKVTVAFTAK